MAVDGGSSVDVVAVGEDRPVAIDLGSPVDVGASVDVGVMDSGAVDAGAPRDAADAGRCPLGPVAECDGRNVNLVNGERDGGLVRHCGACGVSCAAGEVCASCRCGR